MSDDSTQGKPTGMVQDRARLKRQVTLYAVGLLAMVTLLAAPAAAQTENPICTQSNMQPIVNILNAVIQLSFFGGVLGSITTYFGTSAVEAAPVSEDRREQLKSLRKRTLSASIKLVVAGPVIYFVLQGVVSIDCLNLIPFQNTG